MMFVLAMLACMPVRAATAAAYKSYVKKNMVPALGSTRTGTWTTASNQKFGTWLDARGVLTAYTAELNGDSKKECIVLYFTNEKSSYSAYGRNMLHLAVLSDISGKIKKTADVKVCIVAGGIKMDTRLFLKTKGSRKYIVLQNFGGLDGTSCETYVFHVTAKDKLYLNRMLIDPGYTSGVGLYRSNLKGIVKDLSNENYSKGTQIFYKQEAYDSSQEVGYRNKMNSNLKAYGLSVVKKLIWTGNRVWMLNKDSTMKTLTYMKSKMTGTWSSMQFQITVKDYSRWK